jgi:two-component system CheB/CheR fusion protein
MENAGLYGELNAKIAILETQRARIDGQRDALEVFTRALAHDLKEPVRSVRAFSEILGRHDVPRVRSSQYLRYIERAAVRMSMLIDTVFRYTQLDDPDALPRQPCAMTATVGVVKENLARLIAERGATVTCDALPEIEANGAQMIQLLQNLIANAVRHSERPVAVRVRCEERDADWLFAVADNGPGIAAEHIDAIFTPFKRLQKHEDCSGLGLSICRKIVAAHGGQIWCESALGGGATFCFTLPKPAARPIAVDAPETPAAAIVAAAGDRNRRQALATVLLVDDREDDVDLTRYFLFDSANVDCNVKVALDGEQALGMLRDPPPPASGVDLMLLDINMPGLNGFDVLERMRQDQNFSRLPVVMCSGSTYEKDRLRAEQLGAVGYLVKPPSFEALKTILDGIATLEIAQRNGVNRLQACPTAA